MKKLLMLLALLSLVVLPLTLVGCGGGDGEAAEAEETEGDVAEAEDTENSEDEAAQDIPLSLSGFYDPELDDYFVYALDSDGQLWTALGDSWEKEGPLCAGKAPYDLLAFSTPTDFFLLALDAKGDFYVAYIEWNDQGTPAVIEWEDQKMPLGGTAPYSISGFYASSTDEVFIEVIDNSGQLRFLNGTAWEEDGAPCPGEAPYDLSTFNNVNNADAWYTAVVDNNGQIYFYLGGEWSASEAPAATDGPFTLGGSYEPTANAYLAVVVNSLGGLWTLTDSAKVGLAYNDSTAVGGTAPYDSVFFYDSEYKEFVLYAVDSNGELFTLLNEEWISMIDSM